jgi:hypothetical protein
MWVWTTFGKTFTPFFTQTTAADPANQYYAEVGP